MHHYAKPKSEIMFLILVLEKNTKKKTKENVKVELVRSLTQSNNEIDTALNKIVEQVARLDNAIGIINQYEEIVRMPKIFLRLRKDIFQTNLRKKTFLRQ